MNNMELRKSGNAYSEENFNALLEKLSVVIKQRDDLVIISAGMAQALTERMDEMLTDMCPMCDDAPEFQVEHRAVVKSFMALVANWMPKSLQPKPLTGSPS